MKRGSSDIGSTNRLRKKILLSRKYIYTLKLGIALSQIFFSFALCKKKEKKEKVEKCRDYSTQNSLRRKKSYEFLSN